MKSIFRPFSGKLTWVHKFAGCSRQKESPWQTAAVSGTLQLGGSSQRLTIAIVREVEVPLNKILHDCPKCITPVCC
jgi:hypothetical protein